MRRLATALLASFCLHLAALAWIVPRPAGFPASRQITATLLPAKAPRPDRATTESAVAASITPLESAAAPATPSFHTPTEPGPITNIEPWPWSGLELPIPIYYPTPDLDEKPVIIEDINPDPAEVRSRPDKGKLILKLWLNEDGKVDKVEIESSELPAVFEQSAKTAFSMTQFRPGIKNGKAVRSLMRIEVTYH